jgi:hypothetical protein
VGQTPRDAVLTGVVLDARLRAPLAGVMVSVDGGTMPAVTGADGRFRLEHPAGRWVVQASLVGYGRGRVEADLAPGETRDVEILLAAGTAPFTEEVTVSPGPPGVTPPAASEFELTAGDLLALRGVLADDPFRAVQAAPGVTTGDDFRAEFAVRGQGWRQIGVTLDGMDTRLLVHSVRGVTDSGSLAIFNTDVLASARLLAGVHPQRDDGRLGARLAFDLRDGSRDRFSWRGAVSGTSASAVAEGPLGGSKNASFILSIRQSYIDWLLRKIDPETDDTFGFLDGLARASWQVSPRQTLRATIIGARSALRDTDTAGDGPNNLVHGRSTTRLVNLEWQLAPTTRSSLTQRVWVGRADYRNTTPGGGVREAGSDREVVYRADAVWTPAARVLLEGGLRFGAMRVTREARTFSGGFATETLDHAADEDSRAGWGSVSVQPVDAVRLGGGARVEWSGLDGTTRVSPWLLGLLHVSRSTSVRAGFGRQHQHPDAQDVPTTGVRLIPESAWLTDVGVEHRAGEWTTSLAGYYRAEQDGLRDGGELLVRDETVRRRIAGWQNRFTGTAAGLELAVQRRSAGRWSGWAGYALSHSTLEDVVTGERYDADDDQRHTVSVFVRYRRATRTSFSVRGRFGSNTPLPGYFDRVDDNYYLGTDRNTVRLPVYSRIDARVDRVFTLGARRLTLFAEAINVLNRRNLAPGDPRINTRTGFVRDAVEKLFPILPSIGLLLEW